MAVPFHEAKALLKSMFPAMDEATIGEMLRDNGGHIEHTCEQLLAFFDTDANSGGGIGDSGARGWTSHNFATEEKQVSQSSAALSGVVQDGIKTGARESIGGRLAGAVRSLVSMAWQGTANAADGSYPAAATAQERTSSEDADMPLAPDERPPRKKPKTREEYETIVIDGNSEAHGAGSSLDAAKQAGTSCDSLMTTMMSATMTNLMPQLPPLW